MTTYNNQWIRMSNMGSPGYSYVRLQDINRIVIKKNGPGDDSPYSVTASANGTEFVYTDNKKNNGEAENAALELLSLIETALGRLSLTP